MTTPQPAPTSSATTTITIQWVSSAIVWVATVVHQTDDSATIAPTERSMPPPMITNVMPMLTTPMPAASRRIVSALSLDANRSPAVNAPTAQISSSATTRPALRPTLVLSTPTDRVRLAFGLERGLLDPGTVLAHAGTFPSMTRSRTPASSIAVAADSWTTWPSRTTRTRSARPSTSSISLDTTTTATPRSASDRMSW